MSTERGEGASGAAVWDARHRRLTIGLLLTVSVTAFEALAVATVLPSVAADLGGPSALGWYGWVFSAFMLANLVGIPAAGTLSDRGGPVRPYLGGCALFAAGLAVAGLAPSMPMLVLGRVAQGLGAGALSSVAWVAVARGYPGEAQPRMLALLSTAWVVPGLLGPAVAAMVAGWLGWRAVFLLMVPATAVAALLAAGGLSGLGRSAAAAGARPGQFALALRLALGAGLAMAGAESSRLLVAVPALAAGVALAVPALARLLPVGTLRAAPGAPAALMAKFLVTAAFFGAEAFLPLALTEVRGASMAAAGVALTAGTLAWTGGAWLQERLVHRVDPRRLAGTGMALVTAAILGVSAATVGPWPVPVAVVSWAVAGLGIGLAYSTATLVVLGELREDDGAAAAALQLANVLGVAAGAGAGGAVLVWGTSAGLPAGTAIVVANTLLAGLAALALTLVPRIRTLPPRFAA